MSELVFTAEDSRIMQRDLTVEESERCAILHANQMVRWDGTVRLLVREIEWPSSGDYSRRGRLEAELNPEFVARVTKQSRRTGTSLIFVHSHPGNEAPHFSSIDTDGEAHLHSFLKRRHPNVEHAALVTSKGGMRARKLGTDEEIRVIAIGANRHVLFEPDPFRRSVQSLFDRQILVFGATGQEVLQRLRVAIVGLGGMGSIVAQQLVHLGVRDFILIDPDVIEITNLNRVVNATTRSLAKAKVDVAAEYITNFAGAAKVRTVIGDIVQTKIARELLDADVIFGCTDSHGSRAVIQQIAYQYLIPCIDTGVTITVSGGRVDHIYGRTQLLSPGLACLTCGALLDPQEVRRDMMSAFERKADPYMQGQREPAPAVMSLNGTVASLSITMFLAVILGVPSDARHLLYNARSSSLRPIRASQQADCNICSKTGSLARGDSWPIFARAD